MTPAEALAQLSAALEDSLDPARRLCRASLSGARSLPTVVMTPRPPDFSKISVTMMVSPGVKARVSSLRTMCASRPRS